MSDARCLFRRLRGEGAGGGLLERRLRRVPELSLEKRSVGSAKSCAKYFLLS